QLTVADVQDRQADGTEAGAEAGDAAATADRAVQAGAAVAAGGPVVGERAVGGREGGIETISGDVEDAAAIASATHLARAAGGADGLVVRERAVANGERGGVRGNSVNGVCRAAALAVPTRGARPAQSPVAAEGAMAEGEGNGAIHSNVVDAAAYACA